MNDLHLLSNLKKPFFFAMQQNEILLSEFHNKQNKTKKIYNRPAFLGGKIFLIF